MKEQLESEIVDLADPEKLKEIAQEMEGGYDHLPDYVCELWAKPVFAAAAEITELRTRLAAAEAEIAALKNMLPKVGDQ